MTASKIHGCSQKQTPQKEKVRDLLLSGLFARNKDSPQNE